MKAWSAVVSLGLAVSIAVGCGDGEGAKRETPPVLGGPGAPCSSSEECEEGLFCPRGGSSEGACSVECEDDHDCKLHAGDEFSCLEGVCASCGDDCGAGGASNTGSGGAGGGGVGGVGAASGADGGAGGEQSGGAGGSGEEYVCPETSATEANPIIDDFEDGDLTVASLDGRSGEWSAELDGAPYPVEVISPGLDDSDYRLQVKWEPGVAGTKLLNVYFVEPDATGACVHDLSALAGLGFVAKTTPVLTFFRVRFITRAGCGSNDCEDEFGYTFATSSGASSYTTALDAFRKPEELDEPLPDLSTIVGLRFDLTEVDTFEIDDLRLYAANAP